MTQNRRGRPLDGDEKKVRTSLTLSPTVLKWLDIQSGLRSLSKSQILEQLIFSAIQHPQKFLTKPNFSLEKIYYFCGKHKIRKFAIFGSILTANFKEDSDVDILVEFDDWTPSLFEMAKLETELSQIFDSRKIDLRTPQDLSSHFRAKVIKESQIIYDS